MRDYGIIIGREMPSRNLSGIAKRTTESVQHLPARDLAKRLAHEAMRYQARRL